MKFNKFLSVLNRANRKTHRLELVAPWDIHYQKTASEEDIFYCFRLLLGRSPNPEEWKGHVSHAGSDLDSVVSSYVNSLEFSKRLSLFLSQKLDDDISLENLGKFSIYVQEGDSAVGRHLKNNGKYESHVSSIFQNYLKAGMNVIDIGANIGYFTMLSAFLVGQTGSVMAIEPNSTNAKLSYLRQSRRFIV